MITCAIYCIVILFLYVQAELNVIDSGTAVLVTTISYKS